jgi:glutamine synthetase adenylyltransferase
MTGAGVAYAVDTRLRPSGRQGMLVTSFEAFERYQRSDAETWEHLAQLRGRVVAGSLAAAEVLARVHAHILQRRSAAWTELAALRERVRTERVDDAKGALAFKTGGGGLMDVDFLAGGGLLERGTPDFPELPSVPAMLCACASGPKVRRLLAEYRFLRVVEARARWVAGRGVEAFAPDHAGALIAELVEPGLARDALTQRVVEAKQRIRALYETVIEAGSLSALDAPG